MLAEIDPLSLKDIDLHAAFLQAGTGNVFWQCVWRFIKTFGEPSEQQEWQDFLVRWRIMSDDENT